MLGSALNRTAPKLHIDKSAETWYNFGVGEKMEITFLSSKISELKRLSGWIYHHDGIILKQDREKLEHIIGINKALSNQFRRATGNHTTSAVSDFDIFSHCTSNNFFFKKQLMPHISIIFDDFSVFYASEHSTEFLPKETYEYRKEFVKFLEKEDKDLAYDYLNKLKSHVKQSRDENEVLKYCESLTKKNLRQLDNCQKIYIPTKVGNFAERMEKAKEDESWLWFYERILGKSSENNLE